MAFNTGNPIGSTDARDLSDNAENFDEAINDRTNQTWTDRLGVARKTVWGAFSEITYKTPVSYAIGISFLTTDANKTVEEAGVVYAPLNSALPFTTSGTFSGDDDARFYPVQDKNNVIRVTSIAAMEAYSAPVGYVFSLNAGGRSGTFDVVDGDFVSELDDDTLNGVYIGLADDPTAATKVAKRRLAEGFVYPEFYGATMDGTADDLPAIQAAADAGFNLAFSNKVYATDHSVTKAISLPSNIVVKLSPGTHIKMLPGALDGAAMFRVWSTDNVNIQGNFGLITGDNATHATTSEKSHGIFILESSNVLVENLRAENFQGDGLYAGAGSSPNINLILRNNFFKNNSRQGISITYADGYVITGGKLSGTGSVNGTNPMAGLDIEPNAGAFCKNGLIKGVRVEDNIGGGIMLQGGTGDISNTTISNNESINNGAAWGGIFVTTSPGTTISNNIFESNDSWGIKAQAGASTELLITGNRCASNTTNGIQLFSLYAYTVTNNQLISNGSNGLDTTTNGGSTIQGNYSNSNGLSGFYIAKYSFGKIADNVATNNEQGGFYFSDRVKNNLILSNYSLGDGQGTDNTYSGLACRWDFSNNVLKHNKAITLSYAVQLEYGFKLESSDSLDNVFEDNVFEGQTAPISFETQLMAISQKGKIKTIAIGTVAAGTDYSASLFTAKAENGIALTDVRLINSAAISNNSTDYTTYTLTDRGLTGTDSNSLFDGTQHTRDGYYPTVTINAYGQSVLDVPVNGTLAKGRTISFEKLDSGAGRALTGAVLEVNYIEY